VLAHNWHTKIPLLERPYVRIENKIMNDEQWIVSDKDHLGGKPRVQGTRISVAFLLECLASGMSVAEIVDAYPTLTESAVQGALRELAHEKEAAAA
jgi:uncharacterized protein (DUF433 family)